MTELVLAVLYYGLWLALFLVIALLVSSAYFLLKSAWKRKGKIWPVCKRTKGKRKGRSKPKSSRITRRERKLAGRFASQVLVGAVSAELKLCVSAESDCKNCRGEGNDPRWTISSIAEYTKRSRLTKAIHEHELCALCIWTLAEISGRILKRTPANQPTPKEADKAGEKGEKDDAKPKSAWWKRVAAGYGFIQSFGLMGTFFSGGIVAFFVYGHEGPLATIVAVVMFAVAVGFLVLAAALFRVVWRG